MRALLIDLRIGLLSLFKHRRRTGFVGLAIAAVTCLLVVLNGLLAGMSQTLVATGTTLLAGHLNVIGFYKANPGQANMLVSDYEKVTQVAREVLPEIEQVRARGRGIGKVVSHATSLQVGIGGLDLSQETKMFELLRVVRGDARALRQPGGLLLFESQAQRLRVDVGDSVALSAPTMRGAANTVDCRVVAIAKDFGLYSRLTLFVSDATLRTLNQLNPSTTGSLLIQLRPEAVARASELGARLSSALEHAGYRLLEADPRGTWHQLHAAAGEDWTGQKLGVVTWQQELASMDWTTQILDGLRGATMLLLFAIMATGVSNILWIAIRERTREIGALRAIGMQRVGVLRMFMFEALFLGGFAASFGVAVGVLLTLSVNKATIELPLSVQLFLMRDTLVLVIEPRELLGTVGLITGVTCAAALYPSLRAARLQPVQAMGHHG